MQHSRRRLLFKADGFLENSALGLSAMKKKRKRFGMQGSLSVGVRRDGWVGCTGSISIRKSLHLIRKSLLIAIGVGNLFVVQNLYRKA